jgi:aryl-alcohol dehydrogenase-like predicted oxidoreductase
MKGASSIPVFSSVGDSLGVSPYAVAVAWLRSLSPQVMVMPGVSQVSSVLDALSGLSISLTASQLEEINAGLPVSEPMHHELLSDQPLV